MKTYLEMQQDDSRTFFCKIEIIGDEFIEFEEGERGLKGDKSRYIINNGETIEAQFNIFKNQYIEEGYTECEEPPTVVPPEYQNLIDSKDIVTDLKIYFDYLVDSDEIRPVFDAIMETAKKADEPVNLIV